MIAGRHILNGAQCVVIATAVGGVSAAEQSPPPEWNCELCVSADGWELDLEAGPAYVDRDAFRFGNATGLDEEDWYLFGDLFGRYRDDNANYMLFEGYLRGGDASGLFVRGGKQSAYEVRASYQAIPRRVFGDTVTPYAGSGSDELTLPPGWVRAPTTDQMTALDDSLVPVEIGWDREHYGLGLALKPGTQWQVDIDYNRQEREGTRRSSGSFYFSAVEFAAPVDYTTDAMEVAFRYGADAWQASFGYLGSAFRNSNEALSWENPYTSTAGADSGQLALPPDNESHQLMVAGSVLLPARTTLNAQLSAGRTTQNADLLPYTTNDTIPTDPLPATSTDGEVDTLNLNIRAVSAPWERVALEGELRYNDFDNRTDINTYDYVVTDTVPASVPAASSAYDYTRRDLKFRGEYRLSRNTRLHAGYDNERFERNRQERSRTTTNRLWGRMRTRPTSGTTLDLDLFTEDRDGSTYETLDNAAPQNPLMRKYNMADRGRNGIKLRSTVLGGARTDLGFEVEYSQDSYHESPIGLTESDYVRAGGDLTFLIGTATSAYGSVYTEQITTDQRNSQSFSTPDWAATTDDNFTTATLGLTYPRLIKRLDATIEYTWSQSVGQIRNDTSGLLTSFPDLYTKQQNIRLGLSYPYSDELSFGFDYFYEQYRSDDWSLDDVEPDTVPNLLAMGAEAWNYDVGVFYFSARYRLQP